MVLRPGEEERYIAKAQGLVGIRNFCKGDKISIKNIEGTTRM